MEPINTVDFKGSENILAMLPHQGTYHNNYVSERVKRKREKHRQACREWYARELKKRELLKLL